MVDKFVMFTAGRWEEVILGCCFQVSELREVGVGEGVLDNGGLAELFTCFIARHKISAFCLLGSDISTEAIPAIRGAG